LEKALDKNVFSCDARTVIDLCIEEPALSENRTASKSTCQSAGGTWSDSQGCPSGYKKRCADGNQFHHFYASSDVGKNCSQLIGSIPQRSSEF
jgi:hypothetical protein